MIHSYMKQINYLIDMSPKTIVNLINGEVSYISSNKLQMEDRIKLFKFFLFKSDIRRQQQKVIPNINKVLIETLTSEKYRLHIFRNYDLSEDERVRLLKLSSFISECDFNNIENFKGFLSVIKIFEDNDVIQLKDNITHNKRNND